MTSCVNGLIEPRNFISSLNFYTLTYKKGMSVFTINFIIKQECIVGFGGPSFLYAADLGSNLAEGKFCLLLILSLGL